MKTLVLSTPVLVALVLLASVAWIPVDLDTTAGAPVVVTAAAASLDLDTACVSSTSGPAPLFPSILDQPRQGSCSCIDQCRFDFQCVWQYGPGSECVPVGPCDCKECVATS